VFGGIECDSNLPKCFFTPVTDRSVATLIPIITKWILLGTTILSDCWKVYSSLEAEGYAHCTINHSVHFVSESGTHTNNIESRWNSLKKSLHFTSFRTKKNPHRIFRKLPVDNFPHSAVCIPQNTPSPFRLIVIPGEPGDFFRRYDFTVGHAIFDRTILHCVFNNSLHVCTSHYLCSRIILV